MLSRTRLSEVYIYIIICIHIYVMFVYTLYVCRCLSDRLVATMHASRIADPCDTKQVQRGEEGS